MYVFFNYTKDSYRDFIVQYITQVHCFCVTSILVHSTKNRISKKNLQVLLQKFISVRRNATQNVVVSNSHTIFVIRTACVLLPSV